MKEKIIEVHNLTKRYKDIIAVDCVSFDVYRGEIFSLVGPNGAGKTTTVEILECLRSPTTGTAQVLGYDVSTDESDIKPRIGIMPQDFNAFERLSVTENVNLIAKIYGSHPDLISLFKEVGVWEARDQRFESLSGGMKRRVGICMALACDPELLFLDEPTTGLDPQARKETWEVIENLRSMEKTIVLTSHYMEEVEYLSDRAGVMVDGNIMTADSVDTLISQYGGGIKVKVTPNGKEIEEMLTQYTDSLVHHQDGITGIFQTRKHASKVLASLYQHGDRYTIDISEPGMDDVFNNLAGGKLNERGELI
ncbi:MAG: ABC transporter ATP-binding protein [Theionarchaea archaeon]|nr:ABC transporter ATP-binding protein [Theionarchaea archaeon]